MQENIEKFLTKYEQYREGFNKMNKYAQAVEAKGAGAKQFKANVFQSLQAAMVLHELETYDTVHSAVQPGNGKSFILILLADYLKNVEGKTFYFGTLNKTLEKQLRQNAKDYGMRGTILLPEGFKAAKEADYFLCDEYFSMLANLPVSFGAVGDEIDGVLGLPSVAKKRILFSGNHSQQLEDIHDQLYGKDKVKTLHEIQTESQLSGAGAI